MSVIITTAAPLKLFGQVIPGLIAIKSGDHVVTVAKHTKKGFAQVYTPVKLTSAQRARANRMLKANNVTPAPRPQVTDSQMYQTAMRRAQAAAALR